MRNWRNWWSQHTIEVVSLVFSAAGVILANYSSDNATVVALVSGVLILTILMVLVGLLSKSIKELKSVTTKITYYDVHGPRRGVKLVFELALDVVATAKKEILALNWIDQESADTPDEKEARDAYFKKLLEKAQQVPYSRVLQTYRFDDPNGPGIREMFDIGYVQHFSAMLAQRQQDIDEKGTSGIKIAIAPPSVPSTFIIIDDKHIVWQLVERDTRENSPPERWRPRAVIVINDPLGEIVPRFKDTFARVKQVKRYRMLEDADLR